MVQSDRSDRIAFSETSNYNKSLMKSLTNHKPQVNRLSADFLRVVEEFLAGCWRIGSGLLAGCWRVVSRMWTQFQKKLVKVNLFLNLCSTKLIALSFYTVNYLFKSDMFYNVYLGYFGEELQTRKQIPNFQMLPDIRHHFHIEF